MGVLTKSPKGQLRGLRIKPARKPESRERRVEFSVAILVANFFDVAQPLTLIMIIRQAARIGEFKLFGQRVHDVLSRSCGNTIYIEAVLNQIRLEGYVVLDEDVARLSPLIHEHINMLGRYSFAVPDEVARGELRSLRDPKADA